MTIFPEVRLKRYLEMRGSDSGPWRWLPALPASGWVSCTTTNSLAAAWDLVKDWSAPERQQLRDEVPRLGFGATIRGRSVLQLAKATLAMSEQGLRRRRRLDRNGRDETRYLRPLQEFLRGITPAEELLEKYHGPWGGSVDPIYTEYAY